MIVWARWACGAIAAAAMGMAAVQPAAAKPPMWEVTDADSRMVLFGTVHVLRPDTQWKSEEMRKALETAEEVWFEVDPIRLEDPVLMGRMVPLMLDTNNPLSSRLDPALYKRFGAMAAELGAQPAQLDPFKPAPAAVMLAGVAMVRAGYSPDSGVDKALRRLVPDSAVRELETAEQQIRFIADLPDDVQVALLEATLDDMAELGHLDKVVASWAAGDISGLEDVFVADLLNEHPHAYEVFVRARNLAWADAMEAELKKSGTDFVAVGALHLVGPDALPKLLADRGYTVRRID